MKKSRVTHYALRFTFHVSRFTSVWALLLALGFATAAWADVTPPEQPPGSNISPDGQGQTQVVMSAERILIEVQPSADTATAKVTGDFVMRNAGSAAEAMMVRFPLGDPSGRGSAFSEFPTVENFAVQIAGSVLPTTVFTTPNPLAEQGLTEPVKWAAFDVTFPPGQDVTIGVTYNIRAVSYTHLTLPTT